MPDMNRFSRFQVLGHDIAALIPSYPMTAPALADPLRRGSYPNPDIGSLVPTAAMTISFFGEPPLLAVQICGGEMGGGPPGCAVLTVAGGGAVGEALPTSKPVGWK